MVWIKVGMCGCGCRARGESGGGVGAVFEIYRYGKFQRIKVEADKESKVV